jgi:transcriptional regulator with XRE-family HTH domain
VDCVADGPGDQTAAQRPEIGSGSAVPDSAPWLGCPQDLTPSRLAVQTRCLTGQSEDDVDGFPAAGFVRRARRIADASQRELAAAAGVSQATVSRIEAGNQMPSLRLFLQLLAVAGLRVAVVDAERRIVLPMAEWGDTRDGAERQYPAHLDTILDPETGEWWGDVYGLVRPPETFWRDREARDIQRKRSQWEVRVAKHRHDPPPPLFPPGYRRY